MLLDEIIECGDNLKEGINLSTKLSDAEKSICQYMVEHLDNVPYMTSRELARLTYSNPTSILRLSRKFGYANFNDFKFDIVLKLRDMKMPNVELKENDSSLECINKTTQLYENIIERTKNNLSLTQYDQMIKELDECEGIDIIATDMNSDIAHYAEHILTPVGKFVHVYNNQDLQVLASLNVPKTHVVILISKTGIKRHILDNARILHKRGIHTIVLTPDDKGLLAKYCTYPIKVESSQQFAKLRDVIFSISTKYVFDLFYTSLFARNYADTLDAYDAYVRTVDKDNELKLKGQNKR